MSKKNKASSAKKKVVKVKKLADKKSAKKNNKPKASNLKDKKKSKTISKPKKVEKKVAKHTAKPKKVEKKLKKAVAKNAKKVVVKKANKPIAKPGKVAKKATAKKNIVVKVNKPVKTKKPAKPLKTKKVEKKPVTKNKIAASVKHEIKQLNHKPEKQILIKEKPTKSKPKESVLEKFDDEMLSISKTEPKEVLAISNNIPERKIETISNSRINIISSSITNPIKTTDPYSIKPEKEPNGKYEMEFVIRSSAELLYDFLSTSSGLSEWFCDDVNIRNGVYTFIWDGQMQQARLLKTIDEELVRFQWIDKTDGSYFEFKIQKDALTNDVSVIITDFAESASERESAKLLWQSQIEKLMKIIGSI